MTGTGGISGEFEHRSTAGRYRSRRDRDLSFVIKYMTGTGGISGNLKNARRPPARQDVTVVGEIVISVSSGFVKGSVRDSGSRDGGTCSSLPTFPNPDPRLQLYRLSVVQRGVISRPPPDQLPLKVTSGGSVHTRMLCCRGHLAWSGT